MGGDHRAAKRRIVVGRLWVKGVVAGAWQGWVGFWRGSGRGAGGRRKGVEVHTGVSLGGGFLGFQWVSLVLGSWTGDLGGRCSSSHEDLGL